MLLGVINKQRQSALHAHTLVRGGGGNYSQFFNSSEMHFLETCFFVFGDFLFFLKLILGGQFLSFFLAVSFSFFSACIRQRGTDGRRGPESWEVHLLALLVLVWGKSCSLSGSSILLLLFEQRLLESTLNLMLVLILVVVQAKSKSDDIPTSGQIPGWGHNDDAGR